jgi:hypothetical protein
VQNKGNRSGLNFFRRPLTSSFNPTKNVHRDVIESARAVLSLPRVCTQIHDPARLLAEALRHPFIADGRPSAGAHLLAREEPGAGLDSKPLARDKLPVPARQSFSQTVATFSTLTRKQGRGRGATEREKEPRRRVLQVDSWPNAVSSWPKARLSLEEAQHRKRQSMPT